MPGKNCSSDAHRFSSLFNNLNVVRHDAAGKVMSTVRVPLAYAPRDKFLQRIRENADLENDTKTAVQLPRMSFEVVNFAFDPERKAVVLCGGAKSGVSQKLFYKRLIDLADKRYDEHLSELEKKHG